ncbi:hypothetical protein HanXRQr2_Chr10g0447251 [Helianthus annuus]|uniref:Uncharacterized protein n=2 Tax=Helianthus annuus TaxID=4232 RepID=A0A251TLV2_HELAN|nr:hypothetical protein HanXRQr2_Chr10g0447251 [Helianthus annuus]
MHSKINFFNGLYQQADRTRASGCQDLDVMKVALKEFKERFPSGFQHLEAWEVVRKHEKWAQVPWARKVKVRHIKESPLT